MSQSNGAWFVGPVIRDPSLAGANWGLGLANQGIAGQVLAYVGGPAFNDGKGGWFQYNAASVLTADINTIAVPATRGGGNLERVSNWQGEGEIFYNGAPAISAQVTPVGTYVKCPGVGWTSQFLNLFDTAGIDNRLRWIGQRTSLIRANYKVSVKPAVTPVNAVLGAAMYVNTTLIQESQTRTACLGATFDEKVELSGSCIVSLASNNFLELRITNFTDTTTLEIENASVSVNIIRQA